MGEIFKLLSSPFSGGYMVYGRPLCSSLNCRQLLQLASKYLYTSQHNRHLRFRHQNFSALYIDKVLWRNKKVKQQKCGFKELYTNFALQLAVHYFSTQFNRLVFYIPWYGKENFANKNKKIHYTQYLCTQSAILFFADCKFDSRWYFIQVVDYVRYSQFYKHFC